MDKEQLIKAVEDFILYYKRMPYYGEDTLKFIEIIDGEEKERVLRANGQIAEHFDSNVELLKELYDREILSNQKIAEILEIDSGVDKSLLFTGQRKTLDKPLRRKLEMFFGWDMYSHFYQYADTCKTCARCLKSCKEPYPYWITLIACNKFRKK